VRIDQVSREDLVCLIAEDIPSPGATTADMA
jgi:hypothetical protein